MRDKSDKLGGRLAEGPEAIVSNQPGRLLASMLRRISYRMEVDGGGRLIWPPPPQSPGRGGDRENKTPHDIAAEQPHPGRFPGAGITACWGKSQGNLALIQRRQTTALAKPQKTTVSEGGRKGQKDSEAKPFGSEV